MEGVDWYQVGRERTAREVGSNKRGCDKSDEGGLAEWFE